MISGFTTVLDCDMATAESRVREALMAHGFGVLTEIDIAATLKAKIDVTRAPLKILGACNPVLANEVLNRDDSLALLLPCNVVLDQVADGVRVRAVDPLSLLGSDDLSDLATDAGARLGAAIDSLNTQV